MPTLHVNGERREVPNGLTVRALLEHVGRDPEQTGVAVALGDRVVRRSEWDATPVAEGDSVEIVTAAQGG
ncbi:sulfur carrier protein ThiS [Rubrivirga litoralis]|uniref:Sulfur carrier protein ThiS n=1 Tax=Rubrivirga litoralis TaxID=3075598 RepID=A0ABU3BTX0_9BACT|nr:sulfur carrier protein ThiS [Rubrivirga sp. F394]MDT0632739.1 sulfur carrier protein ThiS [Rubrivirga sp. F394]